MATENTSAQEEHQFHTYSSHVIPWYVRLLWIGFWVFVIVYTLRFFIPTLEVELVSPP